MIIKQTESVFDRIELEGVWWIPSLGERAPKCPGVLRYKVGEERELKLWGDINAVLDPDKFDCDVICGECPGNKFVTLFGCGVNSRRAFKRMGISGIPYAHIGFLEMWIGLQPYERKEDVCFREFTFGINNLEQWRNATSFTYSASGDGFARVDLTYVKPEPILLYEDDHAVITVVYNVGPLGASMGGNSFTVEHAARIQITAKKEKLPFYGDTNSVRYYQDVIFQFFTLMIGGATFSYNCEGITYSTVFPETEAEYYQARSLSKEQTSCITVWEMFWPYKSISGKIQAVLKRFFDNWSVIEPYVLEFTAFRNHVFSWTFHTLPELLYAFEGLERTLYKNNKISLKDRFSEVFETIAVPTIFPYLERDRYTRLIGYLKNDIRDAHSHGRSSAAQTFLLDSGLNYNCCRWITLLMTAMVFHKCGLTSEDIHDGFSSTNRSEYSWIQAVFERSDISTC